MCYLILGWYSLHIVHLQRCTNNKGYLFSEVLIHKALQLGIVITALDSVKIPATGAQVKARAWAGGEGHNSGEDQGQRRQYLPVSCHKVRSELRSMSWVGAI